MSMQSVVMSVEELAQRWNVDIRTIYKAIQKKQVVALRVGRIIRISRSHIERLESVGMNLEE